MKLKWTMHIIFVFCCVGAFSAKGDSLKRFDIDFSAGKSIGSKKSMTEGKVEWTDKGVITRHSPKSSAVKIKTGMRIPTLLDKQLVRIEWTFIPLKLGSHGQDFRTMQGPIVLELNSSGATLNTKKQCHEKMIEGKKYTISCDFNVNSIYSWKINGKEQLSSPVSAWMKGATTLVIYAVDWSDANSETLWKNIKISYVSKKTENSLAALLSSWNDFPMFKNGDRASFMLGQASSMQKIFREAADFKGKYNSIVKLHSAGNERESFQIILIPLKKTITNIKFKPTALMHEDGKSIIQTSSITINPIGYVRTRTCVSAGRRIGWEWPDVILPVKTKIDVETGSVQPFWCTVYTPANAKPGLYRGFIKIRCGSDESRMVRVELRVSGYSLPVHGKLKTCFGFVPQYWDAWQKPNECRKLLDIGANASIPWGSRKIENVLTFIEKQKLFDFISEYRLSFTDLYSSPQDTGGDYRTFPATHQEVEYCYKRGMNVMNLGYMDEWGMMEKPVERERFLKNIENKLQYWDSFVKSKNWKNFDWILHCFDESSFHQADKHDIVEQFMKLSITRLKKKFPWLKIETANAYNKELNALFDIWTLTTGELRKDWSKIKPVISEGKEKIWGYTTNGSVKEANFMLDYPGIYPRIMLWQFFQHKIGGVLYFETNCFKHQENAFKNAPKWPERSWNPEAFHANSDGILIYPGSGGEPLASTRLANLRDGIDDYNALAILAELAEKMTSANFDSKLLAQVRAHLRVSSKITTSFLNFTKDPEILDAARVTTDMLIEKCLTALKSK